MTSERPVSGHAPKTAGDEPGGTRPRKEAMVKVVYFDEQSASDFLDISSGGNAVTVREQIQDRATKAHSRVEGTVAARLSWLPFVGGTAEAGAGFDASRVGQSILSKTLSNTILTDFLDASDGDASILRLTGYTVSAPHGSMSQVKMYTPYLIAAKDQDADVDLALLDEALERAKGYYELVAQRSGASSDRCVLRFNIRAFRNNYGLADLAKMRLVFDAIWVGETTEAGLTLDAELDGFGQPDARPATGVDIARSAQRTSTSEPSAPANIAVYDVLLAGVQRGA